MNFIQISPPRLRTRDEEGKRSATWLELFYDLAFVVAVAALVERLLHDPTWPGVWSFLGYFALIWWLWASHTYYADRYDTDDLVYRLLAAGQMIAIVVIAASLSEDGESTTAFAVGYAISRILLLVMYWRAYRHVRETRVLVGGYLVGFGAAAVLWTASAVIPGHWRFVAWAIALAVDLATPWVMRTEQARVPLDVSHLPERFGLFTILVLGESIAAVVAGLAHASWDPAPTITAALGIGIATGLWWLYFDNARGSVVRREGSVRRTWRPTVWLYTHFLLAAALAATGAALDISVAGAGSPTMPGAGRWLLVGSVALSLVSLAIIQFASADTDRSMTIVFIRLLGVPFLVLIGLLSGVPPEWVVLGTLGVCVAQLVADLSAAGPETTAEEGAL